MKTRPGQITGFLRVSAWVCCALVVAACGGGPSGPTAVTYENVAGTWNGRVSGVSQGVTLDGTIVIDFQQTDGALTGGYNVNATLTNATQQSPLIGSVTLTGTITSGSSPTVSFTTRSTVCPNLPGESWSGPFRPREGTLTITGTGHVISAGACAIVLNYPQTITLTR
jgi:hypothetical protein